MNINVSIIEGERKIFTTIREKLTDLNYKITSFKSYRELQPVLSSTHIIICDFETFSFQFKNIKTTFETPILVINTSNLFVKNTNLFTIDCINSSFTGEEIQFRVKNLVKQYFTLISHKKQNDKLRKFFDKNRRKTIDLFGKHVDLKKAQKEIQLKNVKLQLAIDKKKNKTIELFGKHIDLKKAKNEILTQNKKIENQNRLLEATIEKKKRKTIDLFGKHIDLKKTKRDLEDTKRKIEEQHRRLERINEKNKQKTIELFGKHRDLKKAKNEIEIQNKKIEKQNKSITDSIEYASFIQTAVLPKEERLQEILPDHFIFYKPRDIVSGDFYWAEKIGDFIYVAAADCTGHGVPGAFMSMLGMSLLNETVIRYKNKSPGDILVLLRDKIISNLHQTGKIDEAADGMDISFVMINTKTLEMHFAGAHNPVYILREGELIEFKGDRMPIGYSPRMKSEFTNIDFQLKTNDTVYLFSDGYADQFGGDSGMKLRYRTLQQYLIEISNLSLPEQKEFLMEKFFQWKGKYDQVDDILIFGFKAKF